MLRNIGCIVEGHADVKAVPQVLRRLAAESQIYDVRFLPPHRVPRNQLIVPGSRPGRELDRVLAFQSSRVGGDGLLVVMVDADDDDPDAVHSIVATAGEVYDCHLQPVAATREYEAWFLAALESLRSHSAVQDDASYGGDPELPRDAKGVLERHMTTSYKETLHQPAFSAIMDLSLAARAPRFAAFRDAFGAWLHGEGHPGLVR